jgi:hypothetical protein
MATLQHPAETNDISQLTELEYTQAVVEKQRRLIVTKDQDIRVLVERFQSADAAVRDKDRYIRELSGRVQGANAALREGMGAMRKYEDKLKTIQVEREELDSKLQASQSENQELTSKLDVANGLLQSVWQHCVSHPISRHLFCNKLFGQIAGLVGYNDEQSPGQHQATTEAGRPSNSDTVGEQPHSVYSFREFGSDQNAVAVNHPQDDRSDPSSCEERGSRSEHCPASPPTTLEDTGDDAVLPSCHGVSVLPAKRAHSDSNEEFVAKRWAGDEEVAASAEAMLLNVERPASTTPSNPVLAEPSESAKADQGLDIAIVDAASPEVTSAARFPNVERPASITKSTPIPTNPSESTEADQGLDIAVSFANAGRPMSQPFPDICDHPGSCATENCACFKNEAPCRPACSCGQDCLRQFQRCQCNGPCKRCNCRRLGWACVPNECSCSNCSNVYATVPPKLAVCKSTINSGGKGLFALETISRGTYLGDYTGNRVAVAAATDSSFSFNICAGEEMFHTLSDE